mmetsp:Transcript_86638/g.253588  ORF Transcript_86638/g.253588 Transcript_86638/m.253588 type:complete len:327 (-) Transcript_86638:60-1040(-)
MFKPPAFGCGALRLTNGWCRRYTASRGEAAIVEVYSTWLAHVLAPILAASIAKMTPADRADHVVATTIPLDVGAARARAGIRGDPALRGICHLPLHGGQVSLPRLPQTAAYRFMPTKLLAREAELRAAAALHGRGRGVGGRRRRGLGRATSSTDQGHSSAAAWSRAPGSCTVRVDKLLSLEGPEPGELPAAGVEEPLDRGVGKGQAAGGLGADDLSCVALFKLYSDMPPQALVAREVPAGQLPAGCGARHGVKADDAAGAGELWRALKLQSDGFWKHNTPQASVIESRPWVPIIGSYRIVHAEPVEAEQGVNCLPGQLATGATREL